MESIISDIFWQIVIRLNSIDDVASLRRCCKRFRRLLTPLPRWIMAKWVWRRLKGLVPHPHQLRELLRQGLCQVSGSFVLQCVLGKEWDGSDIDIFCHMADCKALRAYVRELKPYPRERHPYNLDPRFWVESYESGCGMQPIIDFICFDRPYSIPSEFDLCQCIIVYDGRCVSSPFWDCILNRIMRISPYWGHDGWKAAIEAPAIKWRDGRMRLLNRIQKYHCRGFRFDIEDPHSVACRDFFKSHGYFDGYDKGGKSMLW